MRRYIVLLLITGIVWAQTDFDKLVLKDGTTYFGEYGKIEGKKVFFKPKDAFAFQPILINKIKRLELKGGHPIIGKKYQKDTDLLIGCIILGVIIYYGKDWFLDIESRWIKYGIQIW